MVQTPEATPRVRPSNAAASAWLAFVALALGQLLVDIDDVVLNIALPSIASDVGMAPAAVPWAVNAYLLAFGGLLLLGGRLADRYGHRSALLVGVAVFVAASVAGSVANSTMLIVLCRGGQGLAAALLAPAAMSLLVHTFPEPEQRAKALGLWGAVTGLGAVVGLVIGGVVTETVGWRWIFGGNAVFAVVVGLSVLALLPGGTGDRSVGIDPVPALAAVAALLSTVWGLHGTLEHGWVSGHTAGWLVVAAIAAVLAIVLGQRSPAPLIPASLLSDRSVLVADASGALVGAALLGTFYFVSLHLQQVLGYSPLEAGWSYLPLVAGLVVAAGAGSAALPRIGARAVLTAGMAICSTGLVLLARLGVTPERGAFSSTLLPGLVVIGLGLGLAFVALTSTALPGGEGASDGGAAGGLYNTALQIGGALGLAVFAAVAAGKTEARLADGAPAPEALADGRSLALTVAAGLLLAGVALAQLMPAHAGRARWDNGTVTNAAIPPSAGPGLRELKKQRTRAAIQTAALDLIARHGYDATTCEQIAAAADVSPATFFRYFPTKEDALLRDDYDPLIAAAVTERPPGEPPVSAVRHAIAETLAAIPDGSMDEVRDRTRLLMSVPVLRARMHEQSEDARDALAGALATRTGRDVDDLGVQALAAACAAALGVGVERWARDGGRLADHVDKALAALG